MDAFCEIGTMTLDVSFTDAIFPGQSYDPENFSAPRRYMTAKMQRSWARLVDGALQGDPESHGAVQALMFYNVAAPGFTFSRAEPEVVDVSVSSPTFTVDRSTGQPRLVLQMRVEGAFNMRLDHKEYLYPFRKEVTYWLVPHLGKDAWLIDGYEGTYSTDEPRRV